MALHASVLRAAAETTELAKPEILTAWPFTDEVCRLLVQLQVFGFSPHRHTVNSLVHLLRLHLSTLFANCTHSFILHIYSPPSPFIYSAHLFTPFAYLHHSLTQSVYPFNTHFQRLCVLVNWTGSSWMLGETDVNPKSCK